MRGRGVVAARKHARQVEREHANRLKAALDEIDGANRKAERAHAKAMRSIALAKRAEANAAMADQRLASVIDTLDFLRGIQGRSDPSIAEQYSPAVYVALRWAAKFVDDLPSDERQRAYALKETWRLLPGLAASAVRKLRRLGEHDLRWSNYDVGKSIGLTVGQWDAIRLSPGRSRNGRLPPLQLRPAYHDDGSPLSEEEFLAILKDRDAIKKRELRRAAGSLPILEHRAVLASNRAIWDAYANQLGLKVDTVKRKVRAGTLEPPPGLTTEIPSRVPTNKKEYNNSADASSDDGGGGLKAPPHPDHPASTTITARVAHVGRAVLQVKATICETQAHLDGKR